MEAKKEYDQGFYNRRFMDGLNRFLLITKDDDNLDSFSYDRYVLLPDAEQLLTLIEFTPDEKYLEHIANALFFELTEKYDMSYKVRLYKAKKEGTSITLLEEYKVLSRR